MLATVLQIWIHHLVIQIVSDIGSFEKQSNHSLSYKHRRLAACYADLVVQKMTFLPMVNSKWVTLPILWKVISSHLFLTHSLWVTLQIFWKTVSSHFFTTNREWVTLHIVWKAVSSHLFLWPTGSEWHCTFCDRNTVSSGLSLWPTACEWHFTFCEKQSDHITNSLWVKSYFFFTDFLMTNREWVSLHILWKAVSFPDLQGVSNVAQFVKDSVIPMNHSEWVILHFVVKQSCHIIFHDQ